MLNVATLINGDNDCLMMHLKVLFGIAKRKDSDPYGFVKSV